MSHVGEAGKSRESHDDPVRARLMTCADESMDVTNGHFNGSDEVQCGIRKRDIGATVGIGRGASGMRRMSRMASESGA